MRNQLLLLGVMLSTGCANQPPAMPPVNIPKDTGRAAAALVFDAPITLAAPPVDITRDDRGQAALIGYFEDTTSYYSIVNDNRQASDCSDQFARETVTGQTGIMHR